MKVIHKLHRVIETTYYELVVFRCGGVAIREVFCITKGTPATVRWKHVTCKRCLRHQALKLVNKRAISNHYSKPYSLVGQEV